MARWEPAREGATQINHYRPVVTDDGSSARQWMDGPFFVIVIAADDAEGPVADVTHPDPLPDALRSAQRR